MTTNASNTADAGSTNLATVTIHGIGPYEAGNATQQLSKFGFNQDWLDTAQVIDFNWFKVVEKGSKKESKRLRQFSRALTEAAQLEADGRPDSSIRRAIGAAIEIWFKTLWIWPVLLVVILTPFVAVYTRMRAVPAYIEDIPASAYDAWLTMLWWSGLAFLILSGLGLVMVLVGWRVSGATLLRRTVLIVLHPIICLLLRFATIEAAGLLGTILKGTVVYGLVIVTVHSCTPDTGLQWAGLNPHNMLTAAVIFAALLVLATLLARKLEAPLKLARDIFNYIGDEGQRRDIQSALNAELRKIDDGARVIVMGHSLGSVIALDSLANSSQWRRFGRVELITAGSPIKRFFQRFFPGLYFPAEVKQAFEHLRGRMSFAKWINVYRAGLLYGDPVGQSLFAGDERGIEIPVKQTKRKLFAAHAGYWEDEESGIHQPVRRMLSAELDIQVVESQSLTSDAWAMTVRRGDRLHDALNTTFLMLLLASTLVGVLLGLAGFYTVVSEQRAEAKWFFEELDKSGVTAEAELRHRTAIWGYGELSFPVDILDFEFVDASEQNRLVSFIEVQSSPFEHGYYFNTEALVKDLPKEHGEEERFIYRIRYLPEVKTKLTLADLRFAPQPSNYPYFLIFWIGIGPSLISLVLLSWLATYLSWALISVLTPAKADTSL